MDTYCDISVSYSYISVSYSFFSPLDRPCLFVLVSPLHKLLNTTPSQNTTRAQGRAERYNS